MLKLSTASSLEKIFDGIPFESECCGSMLKNERYHFQIRVENLEKHAVLCKVSTKGAIPSSAVNIRLVKDVPATLTMNEEHDDYILFPLGKDARNYPDVLVPFDGTLILDAGQAATLWITIFEKDGLACGGKQEFAFETENGIQSISYDIEVIDQFLPESDLIFTNWMHYDAICQYYSVPAFSTEFYAIFDSFLDKAVSHGINMLYTPLFTPPIDTAVNAERMTIQLVDVKVQGKKYTFGFEKLDKFIDFALSKGIKYIEMSHLCTQWGALSCPKIIADVDGEHKRIFGWDTPSDGKEYTEFLQAFLPELTGFLRSKGIEDRCKFHISDEPPKDEIEVFNKVFATVKPLLNGFELMDAYDSSQDAPSDIAVISITQLGKEENEPWVYYCCTAGHEYLPNRFLNMPSERNRILGAITYLKDVKGFLHWGYNFYNTRLSTRPLDPFVETDAGQGFPAGDSFVVYPGKDGAWDSLRHEVFYDGLQDRMALKLLEQRIGRSAVEKFLIDMGIKGYKDYPRCDKWHKKFRNTLNELLKATNEALN